MRVLKCILWLLQKRKTMDDECSKMPHWFVVATIVQQRM